MNLYASGFGSATGRLRAIQPDFAVLVAALAAAQAATRTAFLEVGRRNASPATGLVDTLTTLFAGRDGWASGAAALGHSFNPAVAGMMATARQP